SARGIGHHERMRPRFPVSLGLALLAGLALSFAGLAARAQAPSDPTALLHRVAETYRGLKSYRIEGAITVQLSAGGQVQSFETPLKLLVRRPGHIYSEMKNPMLGMAYVSDG